MAQEYHYFKNYVGTVDCYYRDGWTPAKFFIRYRVVDIGDPFYWYCGRIYVNPMFVHEPAWDFERPRL